MGFYQQKLWFNGILMRFYQPNGDLMEFQWDFTNQMVI